MKRDKIQKSERVSGDLLSYFLLHNLISVLFFFLITISMEIYVDIDITALDYTYIFSREFLDLTLFKIFPISIISSILGRITAFYCIRGYVRYSDRKQRSRRSTKRWSELNRGINRMGIKFIITAIITSFFYTIGVVSILSYIVFDESALLPLMIIYSGLKIGTYLFVRWLVGSKL